MAVGRKTGGRRPGSLNKENRDIRVMILGALEQVGGQDYLARQAIETPASFMTLIGKVLPTQVTGENGAPIAVDFRWADATPAHEVIDGVDTISVSFLTATESEC